jgi:hypothetical protein
MKVVDRQVVAEQQIPKAALAGLADAPGWRGDPWKRSFHAVAFVQHGVRVPIDQAIAQGDVEAVDPSLPAALGAGAKSYGP